MADNNGVRLRLFGLRAARMNRIEEEPFPFSPGLTVAGVWTELQQGCEPKSPMASLQRDMVLALVNGAPIQRLNGWETPLANGDTLTFMVKAFGG
jgi:molybdopterin converting factor small subunit